MKIYIATREARYEEDFPFAHCKTELRALMEIERYKANMTRASLKDFTFSVNEEELLE